MHVFLSLLNLLVIALQFQQSLAAPKSTTIRAAKTCTVKALGSTTLDDAPAIISAFKTCGQGGTVIFSNTTYHINTVMNTTGLKDCNIVLDGTLLWGTNITYWLKNSLPLGYQNQSSAWFLGGDNINFQGNGVGTFNGNGQAWYNFVNGQSNYPGRPHQLTIWNTSNSIFAGLRFLQSQMWTMTIIHSKGVTLNDIYVNSTSSVYGIPARNTDGADTMFSDSISFNRWTVVNGDDSISTKANSTNIFISDSTFINGLGIALGSIGQYKGQYEVIENVTAVNVQFKKTLYAGYIKTWTGEQVGYPPNGGGGGFGHVKNITFTNFTMTEGRSYPYYITQCTTFSGTPGNCSGSAFQIQDLHYHDVQGTVNSSYVAQFKCSKVAPCFDVNVKNADLETTNGDVAGSYGCTNVASHYGFTCNT